jgi:hypothetical protein
MDGSGSEIFECPSIFRDNVNEILKTQRAADNESNAETRKHKKIL